MKTSNDLECKRRRFLMFLTRMFRFACLCLLSLPSMWILYAKGCGIVISRFMDVILGLTFPAVAGSEGVGLVEKVGEGVTEVNPKDTVMLIKPFQGKSETME